MSVRELRSSDYDIDACSRWRAPDGTIYLELPHVIPFFQNVPSGAPLIVEMAMNPEYDFLAMVLSSTTLEDNQSTVQIQWPDGRYLSNPGIPVFVALGTGMRGRLIEEPELVPRGSKVRLNLHGLLNTSTDVALYFEGVLRIPMVTQ